MTIGEPQGQVTCHILDTGYCLVYESMLLCGGRYREIECHSLVALIRHPQHGWGLWDTGYAMRMEQETTRWPFLLYRWATPLRLCPELAVAAQLSRWNVSPHDIRWIILSHLHADHIAGLGDFPAAQFILTAAAYDSVRDLLGWRALKRAFVPNLLPADFTDRVTLIREFPGAPLPILGPTYDVFGDGSLQLVALPGHSRGQVGMLVRTADRCLLFVADAAWLTRAIREQRLPHPLTYLFIDDRRALRQTLGRLSLFAWQYPNITIIPSHCSEAYTREVAG